MNMTGSHEDWTSTADVLRRAREARGVSLEQLAELTRISRHHLHAIEQAAFDQFGAPIYAIGSARSVARALGVPEQPVVDSIKAGLAQRSLVAVPEAPQRGRGASLGLSAAAALAISVASAMIPGIRS